MAKIMKKQVIFFENIIFLIEFIEIRIFISPQIRGAKESLATSLLFGSKLSSKIIKIRYFLLNSVFLRNPKISFVVHFQQELVFL